MALEKSVINKYMLFRLAEKNELEHTQKIATHFHGGIKNWIQPDIGQTSTRVKSGHRFHQNAVQNFLNIGVAGRGWQDKPIHTLWSLLE